MNILDRDTLVENFISNTDIIAKIGMANFNTIEYYYTRHSSSPKGEDMIKSIIEDSFYEELGGDNIEEIIRNVENYYEIKYVDGLVDLYDNNLIKSIDFFGINHDIEEGEDNISKVIMRVQYEKYSELFNDIKIEFITYLEGLDD